MSAEPHTTTNGKRVLQLRPTDVCRTYGVMIRFDDKTKVHYETEVSLSLDPDEGFRFLIDRKQVYINNHAPDLMIDKLADDLGKCLYPLELRTDNEGRLTAIANKEALSKRWVQQKEKLAQYYKGQLAQNALLKMEAILGNESSLLLRLKDDWFYSLFFSGIYGLRSHDFRQKTLLELPVVPYGPLLKYTITREITEQHTESQCLIINCKGRIEEQRSAEDIAMRRPSPVHKTLYGTGTGAEGEVEIRYRLYHKDFGVRSLTGFCSFNDPAETGRRIIFEIYHLPEKDKPATLHRQSVLIGK